MDHHLPSGWFPSAFDEDGLLHQPLNPHDASHSLIEPVTAYRAQAPVNHQQLHGLAHTAIEPLAFTDPNNFTQFPGGPFPTESQASTSDWLGWNQHSLPGQTPDFGQSSYADTHPHSLAIDDANFPSTSASSVKPALNRTHSLNAPHARSPLSAGGYSSFGAFLQAPASSRTNSADESHNNRQIPTARPAHHYHTEPIRPRQNQPYSSRSVPADWLASSVGPAPAAAAARDVSAADARSRSASTGFVPIADQQHWDNHRPINPRTMTEHDLRPEVFSYLGLTLGEDAGLRGEVRRSSSDWSTQISPHPHPAAGRFDHDELSAFSTAPHALAGPSNASRHGSPRTVVNRLENLALASAQSPASSTHSALSAPPPASSTPIPNFSAYEPNASSSSSAAAAAAAAAAGGPRQPRRKANEPPRNPSQRRYPCPLCDITPRTFARPSALKIHMLTHTKEKPHTCSVCLRAFAIPSNLKRHQKLHQGRQGSSGDKASGAKGSTAAVAVDDSEDDEMDEDDSSLTMSSPDAIRA